MKSLQEQFNLINEGKGHKDVFLKSARRLFPEYVTNFATYNEAITILKQRSIINEAAGGVVTQRTFDPFKSFEVFVNEASVQENPIKSPKASGTYDIKAVNTKLSKEVEDNQRETGYDLTDKKIIDNVYGEAFLEGYYAEMKDPKNEDKTVDQLKEIVRKNLTKSPTYYVENAAFGIKGIGYTKDAPGLGEPKAPTGKYKSSGYGNLKENLEQPKKYYAVYNIQGEYEDKKPLTLTANTKEEMLDRLNTIYLELTGETRAPYSMEDFKDDFYNGKKLKHFISDDWASVTDDKETFNRDVENLKIVFSRKEKMNENKLRSIINTIIREELKNESYDYETQADLRGMANEESLAQAIKLAKAISREGVVQHVNQREDGSYEVSDWYDSDSTVFSYQNGIEL